MKAPPEWFRKGVSISAWLHPEPRVEAPRKGGRGGTKRTRYPAQARVPSEGLVIRGQATLSAQGAGHLKGVERSYLEREEANAFVLQDAPIEEWLARWSVWMTPNEHVNTDVVLHTFCRELRERFGVSDEDVYAVEHSSVDEKGESHVHVHAVVRAGGGMDLTRPVMTSIMKEVAKEVVLERTLDRALEQEMDL